MNISYLDIFDKEFLERVYTSFGTHINKKPIEGRFWEKVEKDFLLGLDWENISKRCGNLFPPETPILKDEVSVFLETHCYWTWFARKQIQGHKFTFEEKTALTAYAFHFENAGDDESIESYITEQRELCSELFVDAVFKANVDAYVSNYQTFLKDNGAQF